MTKKSLGRLQRDAAKKEQKALAPKTPTEALQALKDGDIDAFKQNPELEKFFEENRSWDDLEQLFQTASRQLIGSFEHLIQLFKTPGLIMFLESEEHSETKILFEGIKRDFEQLSELLKTIHDQHKHHSGSVKSVEEMSKSIQIFEAYGEYTVRYDALIPLSPVLAWRWVRLKRP